MQTSVRSTVRGAGLFALAAALAGCVDQNPAGPAPDAPARDTDVSALDVSAQAAPDIGVFTGTVRVGVVQAAPSVRVGGTGEFVVRNRDTGAELMRGAAEEVVVSLESVPVVRRGYYLQVACTGSAATRDKWVADATAAGYKTYTEFVPAANCTRLRIGELTEAQYAVVANRTAFRTEVTNKGLNLANGVSFFLQSFQTGVTQFRLQKGATAVYSPNAPRLEATSGRVTINGRQYRGAAEVGVNSLGSLAGISAVSLEDYLYAVLPKELGPTLYPELEALKAQAVAARTFSLVNFRKRIADGYNLRATTDDQVYGGSADEHPLSNQAVDETAGVVATYDGRMISTFYSSTTGGFTASYEEWLDGATPIPYLTGVPDAQRGRAFEHVPSLEVFRNHANPTSLRNAREGDWETNWAKYHRWTFDWTNEEIRQIISDYAKKDVGPVLEMNVLERGPSGRVLAIQFVTATDTLVSTRNGIRSALKFWSVNAQGQRVLGPLLSTLFFIEPLYDRRTKELDGFRVYGGGFGHGVGLSQTGAVGMAERGKTYEEILKHYYQGIELRKEY